MTSIKEKLWNINILVDEIKQFPQTYKTILKHQYDDGTSQIILRRKLNKLYKDGVLCKSIIPGTRFGQILVYVLPKKYNIIVEGTRLGSDVFCFFSYKRLSRYYIELDEYWKLKKQKWIKNKSNKIFFEGNVLKWI